MPMLNVRVWSGWNLHGGGKLGGKMAGNLIDNLMEKSEKIKNNTIFFLDKLNLFNGLCSLAGYERLLKL